MLTEDLARMITLVHIMEAIGASSRVEFIEQVIVLDNDKIEMKNALESGRTLAQNLLRNEIRDLAKDIRDQLQVLADG